MNIEQKLTAYFARYRTLMPRAEFMAQSRLRATQNVQEPAQRPVFGARFFESLTAGSALALASLLLIIVLGGVSYLAKRGGQVAATTSLSNDSLVREATGLTFKVQIKDAEYFDQSAEQVVQALDKILSGQLTP